jgi:hypothetical protein
VEGSVFNVQQCRQTRRATISRGGKRASKHNCCRVRENEGDEWACPFLCSSSSTTDAVSGHHQRVSGQLSASLWSSLRRRLLALVFPEK